MAGMKDSSRNAPKAQSSRLTDEKKARANGRAANDDIIVDSDADANDSDLETSSVSTSSSESSNSDSESDRINETTSKPTVSLDDESSEESSIDSDDSLEVTTPSGTTTGATQTRSSRNEEAVTSSPQKSISFKPPEGYSTVSVRDTQPILAASALNGQQIWHITAPAGIPLSKLSNIELGNKPQRNVVVSHNGGDYSFTEDDHAGAHLILPSNKANGYVAVENPIVKTLHLRQNVSLPGLSGSQSNPATGSSAAAHIDQVQVSRIKPQPKGLKMRYKPPGFGAGEPGTIGSDSSDDEDGVSARPAERSKKRKGDTTQPDSTPRKKNKRSTMQSTSQPAVTEKSQDVEQLLREKIARKEARRKKRESKEARRQEA